MEKKSRGFLKRHPLLGLFVLLIASIVVGVMIGNNTDRLPRTAAGLAGQSSKTSAWPSPEASSQPSISGGLVTSSAGLDWGAGLERLGESPFARTRDPQVFALSVQAAAGWNYSEHQPADMAAEASRVVDEFQAGMVGPDQSVVDSTIQEKWREGVAQSVDINELAYRVAAKEKDSIDLLGVSRTDDIVLLDAVAPETYLAIREHRGETLYTISVLSEIRSEFSTVEDVSGFTRVRTVRSDMIVQCDPQVNDGFCQLAAIVGGADL